MKINPKVGFIDWRQCSLQAALEKTKKESFACCCSKLVLKVGFIDWRQCSLQAASGIHSLHECSLQAALEKTKKESFACFQNRKRAFFLESSLTINSFFVFVVPWVGIEPTLCCQNWILNPARLPIPPLGHEIIKWMCVFYFYSAFHLKRRKFR